MEVENKNINLEELVALASVALANFLKSKGKRKAKPTDKNDEQNVTSSAPTSANGDKGKRSRKFSGSTYIDRKALERFLKTSPFIQHWALCTHDRDIVCNDDGEPIVDVTTGETTIKETHTYILLYTYDAKTSSAVRKIFDRFSFEYYKGTDTLAQNTMMQVCNDMVSQWRYLIHQDEFGKNGKVEYHMNERVCDDLSYWSNLERTNGLNDSSNNRASAMFADILRGANVAEMIFKYQDYYLRNVKNLDYICKKFRIQSELNNQIMPLRDFAQLGLEQSNFTDEQKTAFFTVYDYLNSQFFVSYGEHINGQVSVNLYLKALEEKENVENYSKNLYR